MRVMNHAARAVPKQHLHRTSQECQEHCLPTSSCQKYEYLALYAIGLSVTRINCGFCKHKVSIEAGKPGMQIAGLIP